MTGLIVAAASGLARETLEAARAQGRYEVVGLVDDDSSRWGELVDGVKVIGGLDAVAAHPRCSVLLCAGKGSAREAMAARLGLDESRYATVIHQSVHVPPSCTVGTGSILLAGTVLTASVTIGRHVVVMPNVTLTHDDLIDDFATLCAAATLGGGVRVGTRSYLGMGACLRENVTIGVAATVGMGAVVLNDVPDRQCWVGNPARPLGVPAQKVKLG